MEEKTLTADIERGMASDSAIRFARESEQSPGITPGDVIFKLHAAAHPRFRRDGDDLHHEMQLTLKEALLGACWRRYAWAGVLRGRRERSGRGRCVTPDEF